MKFIAILLVSYFTVLTTQPAVYELYSFAKLKHHSCCKSAVCHKKCCSDSCLPDNCNTCAYCSFYGIAYLNEAIYHLHPVSAIDVPCLSVTGKLISNYFSNCFHPPE